MRNFVRKLRSAALAAAFCAPAAGFALAAGQFPGYPTPGQSPLTYPLTGNELVPADTGLGGGAAPQTEVIPLTMLMNGGFGTKNLVIGGDFATNLWQRGTTPVSAATPSTAVIGADRWYAYSSGNTVTVSKQTGASDIVTSAGLLASMRVSRPSGTNTTAICVGQHMDKQSFARAVGQTVTFSVWMLAGAALNTVANNNVTMTIAYDTAADSATPLTNTATFAAGSITGYATAVAAATQIGTTWARYQVSGTIPATATSGGVSLCYTPASGTGGSTEWFEAAGAQLEPQTGSNALATQYERIPAVVEQLRQQYYTYALAENTGQFYDETVLCVSTGNAQIGVKFPLTMRETPTVTVTAGGWSIQTAAAVTAIGTTTLVAATTQEASLTSAAACTSTLPYVLKGTNTTGLLLFSAEP